MIKVTIGAFWALFLIKLSTVFGNLDCSSLSEEPYSVTAKDFKINRKDVKSLFCTASFCSSPAEPITLLLDNYKHIINYSTLLYSGNNAIVLDKNCSLCQTNSVQVKEENSTCSACPTVPESRNVDIHIRIDNPTEANINGNFCQFKEFFNITVYIVKKAKKNTIPCKDGYNVSLSINTDMCVASNKTKVQPTCIEPSCFDGIKFESISTGSILHQFPQSKHKEACIFNIKSDFKPVKIFYSENIKENLIIYGSSLGDPRWNLANCADFNSKLMINNTGKSFYIVYRNEGELLEKASLSIIAIEEKLCSKPPLLENGRSQVVLENDQEFLRFECNEQFEMIGSQKLRCDEALPENIPTCRHIENAELVPDASKFVTTATHIGNPIPLAYEGNKPPLVVHNERVNAIRWDTPTTQKKAEPDDSQNISNTILLEVHTPTLVDRDFVQITPNISTEEKYRPLDYDPEYDDASFNLSSYNSSIDADNFDLKLFNIPSFKENMIIFILIGVGFCLIIIVTIVSAVVCRNNGSCRSNSGRKFDTFQNPIYEKPIQVPITAENGELYHDKIDLGDLSDSTVLQ